MALDPDTIINLQHQLDRLKKLHQTLEAEIDEILQTPNPDDLRIHRLKREKLQLKDQIVKIDALLVPNIIA